MQSEIFKGHFPHAPLVPGVCMLQLVKDTLAECTQGPLILGQASNIKFLSVITPGQHWIDLLIDYKQLDEGYSVSAKIIKGEFIYFKMSGIFRRV